MNRVAIVSAKRSPIGSFGGSLKNVSAAALGSAVVQDALNNINLDPSLVDEVIFEQTRQILFLKRIINKEHSHKQTEIRYIIQNLVKCSNCNSTLVPIKNNFLQCSAYIHGNCHSSHSVRIEKIEKVVIKAINILVKNKPRQV